MIQIATLTKKTPQQIFARLTEMEKIDIRRAGPDRITWHSHNGGIGSEAQGDREVIAEVQRLCIESFRNFDQNVNTGRYIGKGWKF
jgi:hypothetical protein